MGSLDLDICSLKILAAVGGRRLDRLKIICLSLVPVGEEGLRWVSLHLLKPCWNFWILCIACIGKEENSRVVRDDKEGGRTKVDCTTVRHKRGCGKETDLVDW